MGGHLEWVGSQGTKEEGLQEVEGEGPREQSRSGLRDSRGQVSGKGRVETEGPQKLGPASSLWKELLSSKPSWVCFVLFCPFETGCSVSQAGAPWLISAHCGFDLLGFKWSSHLSLQRKLGSQVHNTMPS